MAELSDSLRRQLRPTLHQLSPYIVPTDRHGGIRLDSNELPLILPESVREQLATTLANHPLHEYARGDSPGLRQIIAEQNGVSGANIVFGNGSGELVTFVVGAFSQPRGDELCVAYPAPSFSYFRTACWASGARPLEVGSTGSFEIDDEAMRSAFDGNLPNICFLARPNNPTGMLWDEQVIRKLVQDYREILFVVDEAYLDYAEVDSMLAFAMAQPNCLVMRTLSKLGLAALRVGYLLGPAEIICELEKMRPPYNLGGLNQLVAETMLRDHQDLISTACKQVIGERKRVAIELASLAKRVIPSAANFILFEVDGADSVYANLKQQGVHTRYFASHNELQGMIRVTIGLPEDNDAFLNALRTSVETA